MNEPILPQDQAISPVFQHDLIANAYLDGDLSRLEADVFDILMAQKQQEEASSNE